MRLSYLLLNNKKGILHTRATDFLDDELTFFFQNAPQNATAIFDTEKPSRSFYRTLENGSCKIPTKELDGVLRVTVAVLDENATSDLRWDCEEIMIKRKDHLATISPNDTDLFQRIIDLEISNDDLSRSLNLLLSKIQEYGNKIDAMLEGYDLM